MMPITTSCPGCKSLFRLPDDLAGQEVRCQKCAQLFVVPMPTTGATEPSVVALQAPPEAPPPAAPPEDAPSEGAPAPETPVEAVVMATLAVPKEEKPKPPPLPKAFVPEERPASVLGAIALLLLFFLGMLGTGAAATIWIVTHLSPPLPITSGPPLDAGRNGNQNFDFGNGKHWENEEKRQEAAPQQINFGFNNKAIVDGVTDQAPFLDHGKWNQDGPYLLFRVRLQEATTYNFWVGANQFEPRLRVFDGQELVAERSGQAPHDRLMVSYQPKRAGDHMLWITTRERVVGHFRLIITPESRGKSVPVDLTLQPGYTGGHDLRMEDPLNPGVNSFGPYRDYEMKFDADREYTISVASAFFRPVLRIDDDKPVAPQNPGPFPPAQIKHSFRPALDGKHRVRVTSEHFGTGLYALKIEPKPIAVQRIIAALDDNGSFAEQRELTANDPKFAGRGSYKEYLLGDLEKGRKYRIKMSLGDSPTALTIIDSENIEVKSVAGQKNASLTFVADRGGTYRIRVFAPLPKNRAEYTLRITTEP